ncbi:MAG: Hsp20/alpha crystallin family protein [Desulfobacteraceae bacterium]|nr:Hsp20/alpha crystallin family protein [Desulfobacteraceae bacterium]
MAESKELQVKEKQEVAAPAEMTRSGLVFTPSVDIFETEQEMTLMADMPGVATEDIKIDLEDSVLTVSGEIKPWEGSKESDVLVEFDVGNYFRQFTLSDAIDQSRIDAKFEDGVLRLTLPKAEKAVPRQISVTAA